MTTYALVSNGTVVNLIEWDGAAGADFGAGITAVASAGARIGYTYDGTNFTAPTAPPVPLAEAQAAQIAANSAACASAIVSGFACTALGASYTYPAKMTDQQNLAGSVLASLMPGLAADWSTPFWCADASGNWAWRNHTAAQIQSVGQAGMASVLTSQAKNATLAAQVKSATTVAEVQAVVW